MDKPDLKTLVFACLARLEAWAQTRLNLIPEGIPSLCSICPNRWSVICGTYVASRLFQGEETPAIDVLVKATLFDTLLRGSFEVVLEGLKGRKYLSDFRVYVDRGEPVLNQDNNSSFSTDGGVEPDYFKLTVKEGNNFARFVFRRASDIFTREGLNYQHDLWIQSNLFYCSSCMSYHSLGRENAILSTTELGGNIWPQVSENFSTADWNLGTVQKAIETKLACNYLDSDLPEWVVLPVRRRPYQVWENSFILEKRERGHQEQIRKWFRIYFNKSLHTFYQVGKEFINLNLAYLTAGGDEDQEQVVDLDRINRNLRLLAKLCDLFYHNEELDTYFYKMAGFLFCLVGKNPRRFVPFTDEEVYYDKMAAYLCSSDTAEDISDRLENEADPGINAIVDALFDEEYAGLLGY